MGSVRGEGRELGSLRAALEFQVAIEPGGRALDPLQLLPHDGSVVKDCLNVTRVGKPIALAILEHLLPVSSAKKRWIDSVTLLPKGQSKRQLGHLYESIHRWPRQLPPSAKICRRLLDVIS
jgi:hypothetical protein